MKKYTCAIIILFIVSIAVGLWYFSPFGKKEFSDFSKTTAPSDGIQLDHIHTMPEFSSDQVVIESTYYKIIKIDMVYYCYFYDNQNDVVKIEGPLYKIPKVEQVDDNLLRFTVQAGTGIGTQWGYYYDTENTVFSGVIKSIFDQHNGMVAYANQETIVVRMIFSETEYIKIIRSFDMPLSQAAEPFTDVQFDENGDSIMISYLAGSDFTQTTENFSLNGD